MAKINRDPIHRNFHSRSNLSETWESLDAEWFEKTGRHIPHAALEVGTYSIDGSMEWRVAFTGHLEGLAHLILNRWGDVNGKPMRLTYPAPEVKVAVGQEWLDADPRPGSRPPLRVVEVTEDGFALCRGGFTRKAPARIRLDRFKPTTSGYYLTHNVQEK